MRHFDTAFGGHERARHGGIDVAHDDHPVRAIRFTHRFEFEHDICSLRGMGPRSHLEIDIRRWNLQFTKKNIGHLGVVMLARMHEAVFDDALSVHTLMVVCGYCSDQRSHLHEIWPRSSHKEQFKFGVHDRSIAERPGKTKVASYLTAQMLVLNSKRRIC